MKIIQILPVLLILVFPGYSQDISLGMKTGIGSYSMSALKDINQNVINNLPFDAKAVENFPAYWYFGPVITKTQRNYTFGLIYAYQSTGSRVSGKDYSGEYRFDMITNANSLSLYYGIKLWSHEKVSFSVYSTVGTYFSTLKLNEYFIVLDNVLTNQAYKFIATNYNIEPGVEFGYNIKFIKLCLNLGYSALLGGDYFYTDDNKDHTLMNPKNQKAIKPDWNGIRAGAALYFVLAKNKKGVIPGS